MSAPVVGVGADQTGADVMLTMLDHDIRHVPVFSRRGEVLGVIVAIDLVAAETRSPFVLRRAIARARNKEELREAAGRLRSTVVTLHRAELAPFHVSDVISAVSDALIRRMIELAIESPGLRPQSSPGCPSAATAGGSRCRPRTSTPGWPGGIVRMRIRSRPNRAAGWLRLARPPTCSGSPLNVADCIRVIGWRLDPHGVTASGDFSASSIEDWRARDRELARAA